MTAEAMGLPAAVIAELDQLAGASGTLLASDVVAAARSRSSALHQHFTWNNTEAATERRLDQARSLISRYKIRITPDPATGQERELLTRGFHSARRAGTDGLPAGTYIRTEALTSPQREALLRLMAREIAAMRQRYSALPEFWAMISGLADDGPAAASGG